MSATEIPQRAAVEPPPYAPLLFNRRSLLQTVAQGSIPLRSVRSCAEQQCQSCLGEAHLSCEHDALNSVIWLLDASCGHGCILSSVCCQEASRSGTSMKLHGNFGIKIENRAAAWPSRDSEQGLVWANRILSSVPLRQKHLWCQGCSSASRLASSGLMQPLKLTAMILVQAHQHSQEWQTRPTSSL